ncbi:MAG: ribonuclease D [Candidatus Endobugula sp.]|jgi:ribonuclease D
MTSTQTSNIFTTAPTVEYQWIDTNAALATLCEQLSQQSAIALDTEFVRTRTYYPHIGLLQIADAHGVYLIDPLTITDTQPMADVLINPNVVKVVHACSEDLEVLHHAFGVFPESLFDTQVAAGFTGFGSSIGYANLMREMKQIDIPKQETRSDWLQRPLSDAQLRYAALDVEYLLEIYGELSAMLQTLQRIEWVESDCQRMIDKLRNTDNENVYYQRIKSAWKLEADQLTVLANICRWREIDAQQRDVPRSRVLKDVSVFDMAFKLPMDMQQLKRIQELPHRFMGESAEDILTIILDTLRDDGFYKERLDKPLNSADTTIYKKLKENVRQLSDELDLPPELLVRKKDYEALIRSAPKYFLPESLTDWRQEIVGDRLLTYMYSL